MLYVLKTIAINTAASATQSLPEPSIGVKSVIGLAGGATSIAAETYTVVSGAPAAGQVQFTGTPSAPSSTLTFDAALAANGLLIVSYLGVGDLVAAQ